MIVEAEEALEGAIDGCGGGEEAASEGDSPVFVKDGALESFDEAVGPAVAWLGACVVDGEFGADGIEEAAELIALIGKDTLKFPAGLTVGGQQNSFEESGAVDSLRRGDDLGNAIGAGSVAGRDLPELADPFEPADIETVQADQLARNLRFDMAGAAVSHTPEGPASPLCKQAWQPSASDCTPAGRKDDAAPKSATPEPCPEPLALGGLPASAAAQAGTPAGLGTTPRGRIAPDASSIDRKAIGRSPVPDRPDWRCPAPQPDTTPEDEVPVFSPRGSSTCLLEFLC